MRGKAEFPMRYIYKENGGKHTALNVGVKQITSELTFIVDSDDIITFFSTKYFNYNALRYLLIVLVAIMLVAKAPKSVFVDKSHIKAMTRRSIKTSTYVMAPMMMGLAFCAEPIIRLVLTDKWLPCVPFMRIFCCTFMFYPIHTANLNAIKAMGRSDLFLKLEIEKKVVGLVLLFSTMWFGVMVMAYGLLVNSVLCQIINSWPNKKLLNYGYWEQLKDILPGILLAFLMGLCVNMINFFNFADIVTLMIQIPLGVSIFIGSSAIFHLESFEYLKGIVISIKNKKHA